MSRPRPRDGRVDAAAEPEHSNPNAARVTAIRSDPDHPGILMLEIDGIIAGTLPNVSEIAPLLIVIRLSEFRYADATAIAVVMLVVSFVIIFAVNRLQRWAQDRIPVH